MGPRGPTGATGPSGPAGSVPITKSDGSAVAGAHIVYDTATLASGTVTVTLDPSVAFSGTATYVCTANDTQSATPIQVENLNGASFTLTGLGSDVVSYICVGS